MKRSPLQRRTPLVAHTPLRQRTEMQRGTSQLRSVSKKRRAENVEYTALRRAYLTANPLCVFPADCTAAATEVHHKRGRVGGLLLDVQHWAAMCHDHHAYVTEHPAEAYAIGISEHRIGAA